MYFFIVFLRALAACLITNSHYVSIYPLSILANGGLWGNIIFFAVSGFCLANIKNEHSVKGFIQWYKRRIIRIYPPMIISTLVLLGLGYYKITESTGILYWFVFPTAYSFISAIILLYIPFFCFMSLPGIKNMVRKLMLIVFVIALMIYWFLYDKTVYHIDAVEEPFICFLYFESMLLGASFRFGLHRYHNNRRHFDITLLPIMIVVYFASKISFSKGILDYNYQIFNQIIIFLLLYTTFRLCAEYDSVLESLPNTVKSIISFVSELTLEIYLVQSFIIKKIENMDIIFPINWLMVTGFIILMAFVLHNVSNRIIATVERSKK